MLRAVYRFLSLLNIETPFAFDLCSLAGTGIGPRPRSGEAGSGVREADMQFDLGDGDGDWAAGQRRFRLTDNSRGFITGSFRILFKILQGMCVSVVMLLCVNDYDNDNDDYGYDMTDSYVILIVM